MSKTLKANLTDGNILKHLINLSLPMSFGVFTLFAFNLADTFYIGQLGKTELAAMAYTFPIPMLIGAISFGIGTAVSSIVSRALGAEKIERVKDYTTGALLLAVLIVTITATIGLLTIEPFFKLMGAEDKLIPYIKEYMSIWYLGLPFIVIPMVGNSVIRSFGNAKAPAIIMSVAGVCNIILDPILIFGLGPFPAMRLEGAAIATFISRILTLIASLYLLIFKYKVVKNPITTISCWFKTWKDLIVLAIPVIFTNLIAPLTIVIVTRIVSQYGSEVVAGFAVGTRIEGFMAILLIGISASVAPFVGQNYGAKKPQRIVKALRYVNSFPIIWASICFSLMYFFSDIICSWFNEDPLIVSAAREYLLIMTIGMIGNGILQNIVAVFNALGKPKISLVANICKMFVIYIPYALLLKGEYHQQGVYFAGLTAHLITGLGCYLYLKKSKIFDCGVTKDMCDA
jgi:putative MATE family efflux protein